MTDTAKPTPLEQYPDSVIAMDRECTEIYESTGLTPRQLLEQLKHLREGYSKTQHEIQQTLGKALGNWPWYKDDPKNFPDASEADGVCVGEHVAETIAEEAARTIVQLREQRDDVINRLQQTAFANSSLTVANQKLLERVRELEAARDALEFQLRDLLTAVKWKSPPVDFGTWEGSGDANYCWEARVPVAFVDNAEAALAKHGKEQNQ